MSKPLELTIYARDEQGNYIHPYHGYDIPDIDIDYWTECKRLTGAELAAEMWMHYWGLIPFIKNGKANTRGKGDRQQILNRFASLPHYDQEPSA